MKPSQRMAEIYGDMCNKVQVETDSQFANDILRISAVIAYLDEEYEKKVKHEKYLEEKQIREESNNL